MLPPGPESHGLSVCLCPIGNYRRAPNIVYSVYFLARSKYHANGLFSTISISRASFGKNGSSLPRIYEYLLTCGGWIPSRVTFRRREGMLLVHFFCAVSSQNREVSSTALQILVGPIMIMMID